jgi:hypothetical protein
MTVSAADIHSDAGDMETNSPGAGGETADANANEYFESVDPGDTVFIEVSCEAHDMDYGILGSEHYFNLTVEYPTNTYKYNDKTFKLKSGNNAYWTLSITYNLVAGNENYTTTLYCYAKDLDSPYGYAEDTDYGWVQLT